MRIGRAYGDSHPLVKIDFASDTKTHRGFLACYHHTQQSSRENQRDAMGITKAKPKPCTGNNNREDDESETRRTLE